MKAYKQKTCATLAAIVAGTTVCATSALGATPAVRLLSAPLVTPTAAWASYGANVIHDDGVAAWAQTPPEIQALANGLGADRIAAGQVTAQAYADRAFEYIRNNIDVEFRFGLGKGGRGALIDQSGTAFDQAHLMAELLRFANIPAVYEVGTITLSAQQFGQWTGLVTNLTQAMPPALPTFTVDARAACQFLADGGIPAQVNGQSTCSAVTGALTSVVLAHIWVRANNKAYDPSFKRYNLRRGLDLGQRIGCGTDAAPTCGAGVLSAAMSTALADTFSAVPSVRNLSDAALATQLRNYANALRTYVEANLPQAPLEEVIGGARIDATFMPVAGSALPYIACPQCVQHTWSNDIPDQYRTTARVRDVGIDTKMFLDEIYGRRVVLNHLGSSLYIDDLEIPQPNPGPPPPRPELVLDHPYAASGGTYADHTSNVIGQAEGFIVLVIAVGNAGAGLPQHFTERERASPQSQNPTDSAMFSPAAGTLLSAQLLYQATLAEAIVAGVSRTRIARHHTLGVAFAAVGETSFNVESQFSINSTSGNATERTAAFETLALTEPLLEGSVAQQNSDAWKPWSGNACIAAANGYGKTFVHITPANMAAVVPQLRTQSSTGTQFPLAPETQVQLQANANEGFDTVLVTVGGVVNVPMSGHTFHDFVNCRLVHRAGAVGLLSGEAKGGGAAAAAQNPLAAAMSSVTVADRAVKRRSAFTVDGASGDMMLTAAPDLVTGAGEFPYALPFERTYQTGNTFSTRLPINWWGIGNRTVEFVASQMDDAKYLRYALSPIWEIDAYGTDGSSVPRLGGGWGHNYQITAALSNDGATGLGASRGVDALSAIAALYAVHDLQRTPDFSRRLTSILASNWMANQLLGNVVTVQRSAGGAKFVRYADGLFRNSTGSGERLTQSGARVALHPSGDPIDLRVYHDYSAVRLTYTDALGSTITFEPGQVVAVDHAFGGTGADVWQPSFVAKTWTFPFGITLTFNYEVRSFLQNLGQSRRRHAYLLSVSNSVGRSLTFLRATGTSASPGDEVLIRVTDDTGRFVSFENNCSGCPTFDVITPDGKRARYGYESVEVPAGLPMPVRPNYRLRSWFAPDDLSTPFLTFDYDAVYRVSAATDKSGRRTRFYTSGLFGSEEQRRAEVIDPLGAVTTSYFNDRGQVLSTADPLGRTIWKTYDDSRRLRSTIAPEGNSVEYTYDVRGNVLSVTERPKPGSNLPAMVSSTTYAEGPTVVNCGTAARCNRPVSSTDRRGRVTNYTYSTLGQLTQVRGPTISGVRAETDYCYTSMSGISLLTGQVEVVGNGRPNRVRKYQYDSGNRFVLERVRIDPSDSLTTACAPTTKAGALSLTTVFVFDALGDVRTINGPRPDTPVADVTTYTFDNMRRLRRVDGHAGSNVQTAYEYYDDGMLWKTHRQQIVGTSPVSRTETLTYWPSGELRTRTDPEGNVTSHTYDGAGRLALVTDPDDRRVGTVYDLAGQPLCDWTGWDSTSPPTSCAWDPNSYLAAGSNGRLRYMQHTYTPNGKVSSVADANNNETKYAYDNHDRLRYTFFPNASNGTHCSIAPLPGGVESGAPTCTASGGTTPTYEDLWYTTDGTSATALCSGDMKPCRKRTRRAQAITYRYDTMNRLSTKTPAGFPVVTHTYNLLSEPLAVSSPANAAGTIPAHRTAYDYDDAGRRLFEENTVNGLVLRVSYQHDEVGNRTGTTWPDGYSVSYQYDALNRMQYARENGTNELAFYDYDSLSRRQELRFAGQSANRIGYAYEPDGNLDALTQFLNGTTVTLDYLHNRSGQIRAIVASDDFYLPATTAATAPAVYQADKLNRYVNVAGAATSHDNNGNLTAWGPTATRRTYTYDPENRLLTAATAGGQSATYDYDGLGRRISKAVSGETPVFYLLDGAEEIAELGPAGNTLRRYITGPGIDDRIARAEGDSITNPTKYYYRVNLQGSTIVMSNPDGSVAQQLAYNEYGILTSEIPATGTGEPFRYTGRRFDRESGLYYYRARYYSPVLGRFLQTDPIGYRDDMNLYAYTANDPVNRTDPTGMESPSIINGEYSPVPECPKCSLEDVVPGGAAMVEWEKGNRGMAVFLGALDLGTLGRGKAVAYLGTPLAKALAKAGRPVLKGVEHAHHIVGEALPDIFSKRSRALLEKLGIDINDAANGARLPPDYHLGVGVHDPKSTQVVWERLKAASKSGVEAVRKELEKMGQELEKAAREMTCTEC